VYIRMLEYVYAAVKLRIYIGG